MIVDNLDLVDAILRPPEAKAVLSVDPNRMLARPLLPKWVEFVAGRSFEVVEHGSRIEITQFATGGREQVGGKRSGGLPLENLPGCLVGKILDHGQNRSAGTSVKQNTSVRQKIREEGSFTPLY
jgi:hypothetical protein